MQPNEVIIIIEKIIEVTCLSIPFIATVNCLYLMRSEEDKRELILLSLVTFFYCLMAGPLAMLITWSGAPHPNLTNQIIARKVSYCLCLDPQGEQIFFIMNPFFLVLITLALSMFLLYISVKADFPFRYIIPFIVLCYLSGNIIFSPQDLAHYHYHKPTSGYCIQNMLLCFFIISTIFVAFAIWKKYRLNQQKQLFVIIIRFSAAVSGAYFFMSLFYVFDIWVGYE